jgi:hypothetical protein
MREDQIDQAERREKNDRKVREAEHARLLREGTTLYAHAQAFADEINQGRFAAIGVPTVTGATPIPQYPAASPSWQIQLPDEPPLGYSVDQVEPIEPSAVSLSPAEQTDAPAGATSSSENLPPVQDESGDAGASSSPTEESK